MYWGDNGQWPNFQSHINGLFHTIGMQSDNQKRERAGDDLQLHQGVHPSLQYRLRIHIYISPAQRHVFGFF